MARSKSSHVVIKSFRVTDVRVPTSDSGSGSDPMHHDPDPDYSAAYLELKIADGQIGTAFVFTLGAGNDLVCKAIRDYAHAFIDFKLDNFIRDPGQIWRKLNDHPQRRWQRDGINRMALGAVINALWDLYAKVEKKPLWQLLAEMPSEKLVSCVDWRYLSDVLKPEDVHSMLERSFPNMASHIQSFYGFGPKAYGTVGWTTLPLDEVRERARVAKERHGFDAFKVKVGLDVEQDRARMRAVREVVGDDARIGTDSNQFFGADNAITHMLALSGERPWFFEEPTHPDDVFGYKRIADAIRKQGILIAGGEHAASAITFKGLLAYDALDLVQLDVARIGGLNELLAVIFLAQKFNKPICPHAGGIGLCCAVRHLSIFDQLRVAGQNESQVCEWLDFLQMEDTMVNPALIENGRYVVPNDPGFHFDIQPDFVEKHTYPDGQIWKERPGHFDIRLQLN